MSVGLYIHIPFCRKKCFYCDFFSIESPLIGKMEIEADEYVGSLISQIEHIKQVETIYIGGGTPTVLPDESLENLLGALEKFSAIEQTIEANPESLSLKKLELFRKARINRLSLGLQSSNDALLKKLGRVHNFETFCRAFFLARKAGFENINVDLIYGHPSQTLEDWHKDLNKVLELAPEHISLYPLTVEAGTVFAKNSVKTDDNLQRLMYEKACQMLDKKYAHYEISNWAVEAKESKHNLNYWRGGKYFGVGAGAAGYMDGVRYKNVADIKGYIAKVKDRKSPISEQENIDPSTQAFEKIMLGLRLLNEGVAIKSFDGFRRDTLERFLQNGVLIDDKGFIKIAPNFVFVANSIILEFMP